MGANTSKLQEIAFKRTSYKNLAKKKATVKIQKFNL